MVYVNVYDYETIQKVTSSQENDSNVYKWVLAGIFRLEALIRERQDGSNDEVQQVINLGVVFVLQHLKQSIVDVCAFRAEVSFFGIHTSDI